MVEMARNPIEKLIDNFLLIFQITDALEYVQRVYETKLQKLSFLSELEMLKQKHKGYNYRFIKLDYGPFSQELRSDLGDLIQQQLLKENLRPSKEAYNLLEDFKDLVNRNEPFFNKISNINRKYSQIPTNKLVHLVHLMPHPYLRPQRKIGKLSPRTPILYPIKPPMATAIFNIKQEEIADLELCLDKTISSSIAEAMKNARTQRLLNHEEIFG